MGKVTDTKGMVSYSDREEQSGSFQIGGRGPFFAGIALVGALTLLAVGIVTAFETVHAESVYPGVRVGDVQVGGMTRERALAELRPRFTERTNRPLSVRAVGIEREASAAELGATFDAAAAVDAAFSVGRSGGWTETLSTQVAALTGGYSVESPGMRVDRTKLQSYVAGRAREVDRPVKDAELTIGDDLSVRVSGSVVGRQLDVAAGVAALERSLSTGAASVDLPVVETQPKRTENDLEEARASLTTIFSGPVALEFQSKRWSLSAKEISSLTAIDYEQGLPKPKVSLKEESLQKLVDRIAAEIDQPKSNARFDWNGGNLKLLRAGQDGRKVDRAAALSALKEAITSDRRAVALPANVEKAVGDGIDPSKLSIKDHIDSGHTTVAGVPEKVYNIKLASSRLNGVLLAPGDMFSFNAELGPTTLKSGFQTGFGIAVSNGEMQTVPSVAGGICQVATTLLHAVFRAGYQMEERYPHMYWIPSYGLPPSGMTGLDATVDDPVLDLKWVNNTDDYLLIQSGVNGNTLQFDLYGTKPDWKVEIEGPILTNVVKANPAVVRQEEPSWAVGRQLQVESANDGMDVSIIRRVTLGADVRTLNLKSHYVPSRNVLMVGTKGAPPAAPQPTAEGTPAPGASTPAAGAPTPPAGAPAATTAPGATSAATTAPAPAGSPAPAATVPAQPTAAQAPSPPVPTKAPVAPTKAPTATPARTSP